jgi:hypothetical protein
MAGRKYAEYHRINEQGQEEKQCKDCKEWFVMNSENFGKDNGTQDHFHQSCRTCQRAYNSKVYQKDPEKVKARTFEYRKLHPDKYKQHIKTRNQTAIHKERHRKAEKRRRDEGIYQEWQRNNKDKVKDYNNTRQHKNHKITTQEWESCKMYFNHCCAYCGLPIEEHYITRRGITKLGDFHKEHVDHFGTNDLSNCIPSCNSCNSQKWEFPFEEWYNENNPIYSQERYNKIAKWLNEDYQKFIKIKKVAGL